MKFKDKLHQSERGLAQITDIVSVRFGQHLYQQQLYILTSYTIHTDCYKNILSMVKLIYCSFKRKVILILVQYLL